MQITEHFKLEDFACHCTPVVPYPAGWIESRLRPLCNALEKIRDACNSPLIINSGYRTEEYNKKVSKSTKSQHTEGRAVDLRPTSCTVDKLHSTILDLIKAGAIPEGGVGKYQTFVHYDTRGVKARWQGD